VPTHLFADDALEGVHGQMQAMAWIVEAAEK